MAWNEQPMVIDGVVFDSGFLPADESDLSAFLADNLVTRQPLVPCGGRTQLRMGNPPCRPGRLLGLARLDRIVAHEAEDFFVTVQAGCPWARLQQTLRQANQWIPMDAPASSAATIGGLIAANTYGPSRLKYGRLRDCILGMRIAQADGTITKAGGRVVKNVTGYDMCRLYAGSMGWLGACTEFHLKTLAIAETRKDGWVTGQDLHMLQVLGQQILEEGLDPSGLILSRTDGGFLLCVRFEGHPEAVEWQWSRVCDLSARRSGLQADLPSPENAERRWHQGGLLAVPSEEAGGAVALKIVAPYGLTPALVDKTERFGRQQGCAVEWTCYAGAHVLWVRFAPADEGELPAAGWAEWLLDLRHRLRGDRGEMILYEAPLGIKQSVEVWGVEGKPLELMQGIKKALDPQGIWNPGRFVGRM